MKTREIAYTAGYIICAILTAILRSIQFPAAMAYEALEAMANVSSAEADNLLNRRTR